MGALGRVMVDSPGVLERDPDTGRPLTVRLETGRIAYFQRHEQDCMRALAATELWPKSTIPENLKGFYNPTPHPAVALDITGPNGNTVNEWGMIDTGYDETAFPARLMPLLGISMEDCDLGGPPAMTEQGLRPNPVYLPGVPAVVVGTFEVTLAAMFPPLFRFPWIALGREDFMSLFRVTFDQRALTTTLEPYGEAMDG